MEKTEDMRIRRTRKLLIDAMFTLLENKKFNDISVGELCKTAMVHRATFYKHFEDKYHFFEFCVEAKLEELAPNLAGDSDFSGRKKYFMSIVHQVLDFLDDNQKMTKMTIEATNSNILTDTIHKAISFEICEKLAESEKSGFTYRLPIKLIGEYYAGALIALGKWWLLSDTKITKDELASYINILVNEDIYSKADSPNASLVCN